MKLTNKTLPMDYLNPNWSEDDKVHNWRNYISEELQEMWNTFSDEQKAAIASNADDLASNEDWE